MTPHAIRDRVCAICLALPEATMEGDRHLGFSARGRRFAWLVDDHHGDGRLAIDCKAAPEQNTAVVATDAERYFLPPYVAHRGWVGAWLDIEVIDWERVEALLVEAYRLAAPRRLQRASTRAREVARPRRAGSPRASTSSRAASGTNDSRQRRLPRTLPSPASLAGMRAP